MHLEGSCELLVEDMMVRSVQTGLVGVGAGARHFLTRFESREEMACWAILFLARCKAEARWSRFWRATRCLEQTVKEERRWPSERMNLSLRSATVAEAQAGGLQGSLQQRERLRGSPMHE